MTARVTPVLACLVLLLAACSSTPSAEPSGSGEASASAAASAEPSATAAGFTLFALGDSIPFNSPGDCPGCTGFVDSYAAALALELDESVTAVNRSRHDGARTIDIRTQLQEDDAFLAELADADLVVMSVGFNDQPPFVDEHEGCPPPISESATNAEAIEAGAATSHACVDTAVAFVRDQIGDVFAAIRDAAPDAPIAVLTAYDSWRGWSELDQVDPATTAALYNAVTYWLQSWRTAMCEEAAVVEAVCVDVYTAFNGADGSQPPGDLLAADHTHPSQEGNDAIRDLLVEAGLID